MSKLTIDLFSDIVCPWCFIGSRKLTAVLEELKIDAEVVHHPFELDPSCPETGVNIGDKLKQKYGADPKQMFARVESAARDAGVELDLSKQPMSYPTVKAHTLLRHAAAKGTQRALTDALHTAHFVDAKNICNDAVLTQIATQHGFTADEVASLVHDEGELKQTNAEAREASAQGISGVPFFIFGQKFAISGSQSTEVFRQAITKALSA